MNFLGHAVLSFREKGTLTGNLLGDFVRGRLELKDYPEDIKNGMILHRSIDSFTDNHSATLQAARLFKSDYRLYADSFIDIVYDHFLANDTNVFPSKESLMQFSQWVYRTLNEERSYFPEVFKRVFPHMRDENWLYDYRQKEGIGRAFEGLVRRAKYMNDADPAYNTFLKNYGELQNLYEIFFPDAESFALEKLNTLKSI